MGIRQAQRYCAHDDKLVMAFKETPNHLLHLVLSVMTGGLWLIVWFLVSLKHNPYRCPHCGGKTDGVWLFKKIQKERQRKAKAVREVQAKGPDWTDDFEGMLRAEAYR